MASLFGYILLAIGVGVSAGLLGQATPPTQSVFFLLLALFLITAGSALGFRRFVHLGPPDRQVPSEYLFHGALLSLGWALLVLLAESAVTHALPSIVGAVAALCFGTALFGLWIERYPTVPGAKIAVVLLYAVCAVIAVSTLVAPMPPSVFWVVSAAIPARQAKRLATRGDLLAAFRLVNAAIRMFVWVLFVALAAPALLQFR